MKETESDRDKAREEKNRFVQCGGRIGPRERLESVMGVGTGNASNGLFDNTILLPGGERNEGVVGDRSGLPRAIAARERDRKEHEARAVSRDKAENLRRRHREEEEEKEQERERVTTDTAERAEREKERVREREREREREALKRREDDAKPAANPGAPSARERDRERPMSSSASNPAMPVGMSNPSPARATTAPSSTPPLARGAGVGPSSASRGIHGSSIAMRLEFGSSQDRRAQGLWTSDLAEAKDDSRDGRERGRDREHEQERDSSKDLIGRNPDRSLGRNPDRSLGHDRSLDHMGKTNTSALEVDEGTSTDEAEVVEEVSSGASDGYDGESFETASDASRSPRTRIEEEVVQVRDMRARARGESKDGRGDGLAGSVGRGEKDVDARERPGGEDKPSRREDEGDRAAGIYWRAASGLLGQRDALCALVCSPDFAMHLEAALAPSGAGSLQSVTPCLVVVKVTLEGAQGKGATAQACAASRRLHQVMPSLLADLCDFLTLQLAGTHAAGHRSSSAHKPSSNAASDSAEVLSHCLPIAAIFASSDESARDRPSTPSPRPASQILDTGSISGSDRWCLVSCMVKLLQALPAAMAAKTPPPDALSSLLRLALRSLGSIISSSSPTTFPLLLATHLPTAICELLGEDRDGSPPAGTGKLPSPSAAPVDHLSITAFAAHTLALLLHPVGDRWGRGIGGGEVGSDSIFPLERMLLDQPREEDSVSAGLRGRVSRTVCERLLDGGQMRLVALLALLEYTSSPGPSPSPSPGPGSSTSSARSPAVRSSASATTEASMKSLRSALLRVLVHITTPGGTGHAERVACLRAVATYNTQAIPRRLLAVLHPAEAAGAVSVGAAASRDDIISHGLAAALLRNLVTHLGPAGCLGLEEDWHVRCVDAAWGCAVQETRDGGDVRVAGAAVGVLAAMLRVCRYQTSRTFLLSHQGGTHSSPPSHSGPREDGASPTSEDDEAAHCPALPAAACARVLQHALGLSASPAARSALLSLLTALPDAPEGPGGVPTLWLLGAEFGCRSAGALDSVLEFLAELVELDPGWFEWEDAGGARLGLGAGAGRAGASPKSLLSPAAAAATGGLGTSVCPRLVARLLASGGGGEVSPVGVQAALRVLTVFAAASLGSGLRDSAERSMAMAAAQGTGPSGTPKRASPTRGPQGMQRAPLTSDAFISLVVQEGVVGIVSLVLLPQHLDWSYRWVLAGGEGGPADWGVSMTRIVQASASLLRSVLQHVSGPAGAEAQAAVLETFHRTQLIRCLLTALTDHCCDTDAAGAAREEDESAGPDGTLISTTSSRAVAHAVYVLSELVLTTSRFLTQFVEGRGLEMLDALPHGVFRPCRLEAPLRDDPNPNPSLNARSRNRDCARAEQEEVLVSALQLCSHLARHSESHYHSLFATLPPHKLGAILVGVQTGAGTVGGETGPRRSFSGALLPAPGSAACAKACNLMGNLCRHSSRFYPSLAAPLAHPAHPSRQTTLIALLIECLSERDTSTRKFAAFAIGNAAFHSSALYGVLEDAVAPLARLLAAPAEALGPLAAAARPGSEAEAEEDKTRANAAGALGNLVRNGGALAPLLASSGALQALVSAAMPPASRPASASACSGALDAPPAALSGTALSTCRTALFSLGTAAAYQSCRQALLQCSPSLQDLVQAVRGRPSSAGVQGGAASPAAAGDETMTKYLGRLKGKLSQQAAPEK